jgi:DNA-directed RNA polymerase beta subunit
MAAASVRELTDFRFSEEKRREDLRVAKLKLRLAPSRTINTSGQIHYCVRWPILNVRTLTYVGFKRLSGDRNVSFADMSYSGYDIEDAIVSNMASLDRGFGRSSVIRNATRCRRYARSDSDRIMLARPDCDMSKLVNSKKPLLPRIGARLPDSQLLMGGHCGARHEAE